MYNVYSQDSAEMQKDAISEGQKVIIFDDVLATGGEYLILKLFMTGS